MLKFLKLNHVGPVHPLVADFADRLNVFTGDNGLGKSFVLDVCFWALTATWPKGRMALPEPGRKSRPTITYHVSRKGKPGREPITAPFDFGSQTWTSARGLPVVPGLVIYGAVDGGFSVWDPARHYGRELTLGDISHDEIPRAYQFTHESVASGLIEGEKTLCNGLIRDWVEWYYERSSDSKLNPFQYLENVIALFSHPEEPVACVEPRRVFVDDIRKFPTLKMPYGIVPFPQWSAGLRRVVSLAYLMVWAWVEHLQAAELRQEEPSKRLVLIVDEIESHLHPKWQRTILPALLGVAEKLQADLEVQILVATHSPIVLASIEPHFDAKRDKLFCFDLQDGSVSFRESLWTTQGDVVGWLTSEVFGLRQARSKEAEIAIEAAEAFMRGDKDTLPKGLETKERIERALKASLPGLDPFWPRWIVEARP